MNSALNAQVANTAAVPPSKPMHPQGAAPTPATYNQQGHAAQHLHPSGANHFALNVPNSTAQPPPPPASYGAPTNVGAVGPPAYGSPAKPPFVPANLAHPPNPPNPLPPVSQTLPATAQTAPVVATPPVVPPPAPQPSPEKPQSNGTGETNKTPTKSEPTAPVAAPTVPIPTNHVSPVKEQPAQPQTPEKPVVEKQSQPAEPLKATPEKVEPPKQADAASETEKVTDKQQDEPDGLADGTDSNGSSEMSKHEEPQKVDDVEKVKEKTPTKAATSTTPRTPTRKAKTTPKASEESPKATKEAKQSPSKTSGVAKVKRQRIRTQPYQSPLPELEIITKITASTPRSKTNDDKLIVFYKNEFLAVRNAEGSFFVCQAVQNVYKSSSKIKIRWLSQDTKEESGEIYTPDFYDLTDFDCILTNLNLTRVDKGKYRLPNTEKERTDKILRRSLAIEKGEEIQEESFTEEHPDGLDISLYTDENQINKKSGKGRKRRASPGKSKTPATATKKSPEHAKVRKTTATTKASTKKKAVVKKVLAKVAVEPAKKTNAAAVSRSARAAKRRSDAAKTASPVLDQKKARVLAKVARKAVPATSAVAKSKAATKSSRAAKATTPTVKATKAASAAASTSSAITRKTKRTARK